MTADRDLPWLQDTTADNVKGAYAAEYREVVILDPWNRKLVLSRPFNLTEFDLASEVNRGVLKELLRLTAQMTDSDEDGVADDWEERFLGGLDGGVGSDTDGDGGEFLLEYGLGSHPDDSGSLPTVTTGTAEVEGEDRFSISFRRRMGDAGGLKYWIEKSSDGENWSDASGSFSENSVENPYDGTGTEIVTIVSSGEVTESALYRVRVVLP